MEETLRNWSDQILPWITSHGIRIVIIAILALVINRLLKRLIIRAVRASVKSDEHTSEEAEKKQQGYRDRYPALGVHLHEGLRLLSRVGRRENHLNIRQRRL